MLRALVALLLVVAWPMSAGAVSSSVLTTLEATTILDNFDYTENPISNGGKWTNQVITGDDDLSTNGSAATDDTPVADSTAFRNDRDFGPSLAALVTIVSKPSGDEGLLGIYISLQGTGLGSGAPDGFRGEIRVRATTDEFRIQRIDAGTPTVVSSGTLQEVSAGDKFAVVRSGTTIELWWKTGSTWSLVVSYTSATQYTNAGRIGLHINDLAIAGTAQLDDLQAMNLGRQLCIGCGIDKKVIGE